MDANLNYPQEVSGMGLNKYGQGKKGGEGNVDDSLAQGFQK